MAEKKKGAKPKEKAARRRVNFSFTAPEALKVFLTGDFNGWAGIRDVPRIFGFHESISSIESRTCERIRIPEWEQKGFDNF